MKTKYPIVLVHGIAIKDFNIFRAFGKIQHLLEHAGNKVSTAKTDSFGRIQTNAEQLREHIEKVLAETGAEKVNIIAHSKGGLDTRYMIYHLGMADKVASVTFLCTPHKGSQIATKLYNLPHPARSFIAHFINFWYRLFGDKHPDALSVCKQLAYSPDGVLEDFSHVDGVYMQSYSTKMERSGDDFIMGIPHIFSRKFENDHTDGIVSVESSKFRHYRGHCLEESVSHTEIVDFMVKKSKKEKIYAFYLSVCRELSERGY